MKVYVDVDQVECVRRGINAAQGANVAVELDPRELADEDRELVASRLSTYPGGTHRRPTGLYVTRQDSNHVLRVIEPTVGGIVAGILADQAAAQAAALAKAAAAAQKREEVHARTMMVLQNREVSTTRIVLKTGTAIGDGGANIEYQQDRPNWPYEADQDVVNGAEAALWCAQLASANLTARAAADAEVKVRVAAQEGRVAAASRERGAWIAAHGSERLRRMHTEGIECRATYCDERLAVERPGWKWVDNIGGGGSEPRNPPASAFKLLDEARLVDPQAKLRWWTADHDHDENSSGACVLDGDCPKYDWTGYLCSATFLGHEILFGVNAELEAIPSDRP